MASVTTSSAGNSPYDSYQTSSPPATVVLQCLGSSASDLVTQLGKIYGSVSPREREREKELGTATITAEALEQMKAQPTVTDEELEIVPIEEKSRRYDVMAHVHASGAVAPAAAGIIYLGATSYFVTVKTELILVREAMDLKSEPSLAYTHLQAAQLITVGKRAAQWVRDFILDLHPIKQGDTTKCDQLNELLCQKFGFPSCCDVSTLTYTCKVDLIITNAVAGLGSIAQKITGDIHHLMHWKDIESSFPSSKSRHAREESRVLSHQAGIVVKKEGKLNDLVERIKANEFFKPIWDELDGMPKAEPYTRRSSQIVEKH
ncbi:hypothetical protein F4810DRAFT_714299 [Camillea tinctor]|nr:hypothetical protein F4810DRAFT_714299 [Camillea tinctor]